MQTRTIVTCIQKLQSGFGLGNFLIYSVTMISDTLCFPAMAKNLIILDSTKTTSNNNNNNVFLKKHPIKLHI